MVDAKRHKDTTIPTFLQQAIEVQKTGMTEWLREYSRRIAGSLLVFKGNRAPEVCSSGLYHEFSCHKMIPCGGNIHTLAIC